MSRAVRGRPLKGEERLDTRLGFRVPNRLLNDIETYCIRNNITKSEFVVSTLEEKFSSIRGGK